jgi:hypothetical protein
LDIISRITVSDLSAVLAKYPLTRSATVTIGPLAGLEPPQ